MIIPARNEELVIGRCLSSLLADTNLDDVDVVVVLNGCTDDTRLVVEDHGYRCIEIDQPGKHRALNAGLAATKRGPRIFLDADSTVSVGAISAVLAVLEDDSVSGAAPEIHIVAEDPSFLMRRYLRVWRSSPYFGEGHLGAGFYGLSQSAVDRLCPFPELIADDMVVLGRLEPEERRTVHGHTFTHILPNTIRELLPIEIRRGVGLRQFRSWVGPTSTDEQKGSPRWLVGRLSTDPIGVLVFASLRLVTNLVARRPMAKSDWKPRRSKTR